MCTRTSKEGSTGVATMLGNGILGIQRESNCKIWERRAPLTPSHCARLLNAGRGSRHGGVKRILVQPSTKRVLQDIQYENVGCEISEDLSECGLILGVKQPELGTLLPERAYAFFSHTHKGQPENMPLLDEVLSKNISLYDYERIVGDKGERLVAFGEYAGRAGMIDFLRGLGERYLSLGYSTPFLSIGSSFMYASLSAAKAAVLQAGDEIRANGLPSQISPLVFIFTGSGNVSQGAQEIFRLLPHKFVEPSELPKLASSVVKEQEAGSLLGPKCNKRTFEVYGCIVTTEHMVAPKDPTQKFHKDNYYAHPERYYPIFHEKIAPYASVIVNCIYWESRFPRLLTNGQLQSVVGLHNRLIGVADISCDIGGSIECVKRTTSSENPFYRYDPLSNSYYNDMNGKGIIILATDNLPTELARESTNHFGEVLLPFLPNMVSVSTLSELLLPVQQACIAHKGQLTLLYEYIHRMRLSNNRKSALEANARDKSGMEYKTMVSLDGHLFDHLLINEALDVIENAGGQFRLAACELGQTVDSTSHAELEVIAKSEDTLSNIVDLLASVAHRSQQRNTRRPFLNEEKPFPATVKRDSVLKSECNGKNQKSTHVLIFGAGRMCKPVVNFLAYHGLGSDRSYSQLWVTVASMFLKDAVEVTNGIPNTSAVQLDVSDKEQLVSLISEVSLVISLLPPSFHTTIAAHCIQCGKHLVTASYVSMEMAALHEKAKQANVTLLCEMGLDPGIDHMMAMKMIDSAHQKGGHVESFISYCGGLPAPASADNPLGYKFSWNPAGALKAGRNPAVYKDEDKIINVPGDELFSSSTPFRIPNFPAFALERLPNRDSLQYGNLYGISGEASTVFRATLRYEGYSDIMNSLAKLGYFNTEACTLLQENKFSTQSRPSYRVLFEELLQNFNKQKGTCVDIRCLKNDPEVLVRLGCCENLITAKRLSDCIRHVGLDTEDVILTTCSSAFDVLCSRMEEKLTFAPDEQDMVLLHHEIKIKFDDSRPSEKHVATLLEFGDVQVGATDPFQKPHSAMARTVGLPAAIGAQLLLLGKLNMKGVVRPLYPEIYTPVLEILESTGIHIRERTDQI